MVKDYVLIPRSNPNERDSVKCKSCHEIKEHHSKGMCYKCYKKQWKPYKVICKNCDRERGHKAFGLCGSCHTKLHHYGKVKIHNAKKYQGISYQIYTKVTKKCLSCGFDKIVELHHLDGDHGNSKEENLIGLCPNCHKLIHMDKYFEEIKENLKKRGIDVSKINLRFGK